MSADTMRRHVLDLAECYAYGWDHGQQIDQCEFAMVTAATPLPDRFSSLDKNQTDRRGMLRGFFVGGQDPYMEPRPAKGHTRSGFNCTIVDGFTRSPPEQDVNIEDTVSLYERNYPCDASSGRK